MVAKQHTLTYTRLRQLLLYNPGEWLVYVAINRGPVKKGSRAGFETPTTVIVK